MKQDLGHGMYFNMTHEFVLIRHGETDWNQQRILQGHANISLNENGRIQSVNLGRLMRQLFSHPKNLQIQSSDLLRAQQTCELMLDNWFHKAPPPPVSLSRDLREVFLGQAEGQSRDEIPRLFGEENWQRWLSREEKDLSYGFPEGESRRQALERFSKHVFKAIEKQSPELTVIITHGLIMRTFTQFYHPEQEMDFLIPNCSILRFQMRTDPKLNTSRPVLTSRHTLDSDLNAARG